MPLGSMPSVAFATQMSLALLAFGYGDVGLAQCSESILVPSHRAPTDHFGVRRSLAVDGDTLVAGSYEGPGVDGEGFVYVFERQNGVWVETQILRSGQNSQGQYFGRTVAIDGDTIMAGTTHQLEPYSPPGGGAVFVFEKQGDSWVRVAKFFNRTFPSAGALDGFGVHIHIDGDVAYIADDWENRILIIERIGGIWVETGALTPANVANFPLPSGTAFGTGWFEVEDDLMVISHGYGGQPAPVSVLEFDGTTWTGVASLAPPGNADFETAPTVSLSNGVVYVGSSLEISASGVVRIFEELGGDWIEVDVVSPPVPWSNMRFGLGLDARRDTLVVGAPGDDIGPTNDNNGALYQYRRNGFEWVLERRIITDFPALSADMGLSVELTANEIITGGSLFSEGGRLNVFPLRVSRGTTFGDPNPNSSGWPARLVAEGSVVAAHDCLTLNATILPADQVGYFLMSRTQSYSPNVAGSQGDLLLAPPWYRFSTDVLETGDSGEVELPLSLNDLPQGVQFQPGETWSFQLWFRDDNPMPTSNLSNGLALTLATLGDPAVQFPVSLVEVEEDLVRVPVDITLSQPTDVQVLVPYTLGGTATVGSDWELDLPSPIVLAAGETSSRLWLTVFGDSEVEPEETCVVTLGRPTAAVLGSSTEFTLTITPAP
ncbi:MAG: hypothetical protein GY711_15685 [bacterium]|nr:hypothetical protein [bacterium]